MSDDRREVADEALERLHLRVKQHLDTRVLGGPGHESRHHVSGGVEIGGREIHPGHVAAQVILPLHEVHTVPSIGQFEGGGHAHHASPDDQHVGVHLHRAPLQGFVVGHSPDGRKRECPRLVRRHRGVVVHPTALLADVGHLDEVGVDPRRLQGFAEGRLVHPGAAGGHDHAIQTLRLDVLDDHLLPGVGAHVLVRLGYGHPRLLQRELGHGVAVDHLGDVGAAVADIDADLVFFHHDTPATWSEGHGTGAFASSVAGSASARTAEKYMASGR